jgi:hypothetical protein
MVIGHVIMLSPASGSIPGSATVSTLHRPTSPRSQSHRPLRGAASARDRWPPGARRGRAHVGAPDTSPGRAGRGPVVPVRRPAGCIRGPLARFYQVGRRADGSSRSGGPPGARRPNEPSTTRPWRPTRRRGPTHEAEHAVRQAFARVDGTVPRLHRLALASRDRPPHRGGRRDVAPTGQVEPFPAADLSLPDIRTSPGALNAPDRPRPDGSTARCDRLPSLISGRPS